MNQKKKKSSQTVYIIAGAVVLIFLLAGGGLFFLMSTDEESKAKSRVAAVSLLKPPPPMREKPPPPLKEKPPEPEVKKETIEAIREAPRPEEARNEKADDKPAGDQLGLDAQGGAGSDSFGLVGRKGGRDLLSLGKGSGSGEGSGGSGGGRDERKQKIGGGNDLAALMRRNAWYNNLVEQELTKGLRKRLQENGGIPKGKLEAVVQIGMDDGGSIREFRIIRSSGNHSMDEALKEFLASARVSEPPPGEILRAMKDFAILRLRITSQG